jgi:RNA polymerase sigma factor (sigma-70 family)
MNSDTSGNSQKWSPDRIEPMLPEAREQDRWSALMLAVANHQDREAFARLFQHFAPLLKSYALSHAGALNANQAEELIQEAMLKVWNKAKYFDPAKASASTWIYTIARNTRTDMLRRRNSNEVELTAEDIWPDDEASEPFSILQQRRAEVAVRSGLSQLPAEQAQILTKVYMEGKSHTEVANELRLPLGTVKSRVRLAMQKMKLWMER